MASSVVLGRSKFLDLDRRPKLGLKSLRRLNPDVWVKMWRTVMSRAAGSVALAELG